MLLQATGMHRNKTGPISIGSIVNLLNWRALLLLKIIADANTQKKTTNNKPLKICA